MEAFLERIANGVSKEKLPYLYKCCYIFPNKRATLYFTDFLIQRFPEENFILPETLTIQEFVIKFSNSIIKDNWWLILELYQLQNELTNTQQPIDKFFPWGKLILKDFDECDKYLVNTTELFSLLRAQKNMDELFSLSEETRKLIEQFILTTDTKDKESLYKSEFIKTWNLLGEMYDAFKDKLKRNNFAYEGMAYREVYENLLNGTLMLPYSQISFCGFNALSVCEEKIFKLIEEKYDSEFWWDADEHFMNNPLHEAGNFMRHYQKLFTGKQHHWIIDNFLTKDKSITIAGISSDVGQTHYVKACISKDSTSSTAIVLCDENLLTAQLSVLESEKLNITMGYPVTQSELYIYLITLLGFYSNARVGKTQTDYFHRDVAALSRHPFLQSFIREQEKLDNILPLFVPYIPQQLLAEHFPEFLFPKEENSIEILKTLIGIISALNQDQLYFFEVKEVILTNLNYLLNLLREKNINPDVKSLPFFVKQFVSSAKVPFEKPKENSIIQVMGFLETRILDFETVYILSLNDDNLPGSNKTNSFIPYNLRKGFGLPTFEQFDGINAYHFYRLLKRAKTIHLIYNNQMGDNASEKSRFIRQIEHDLVDGTNTIKELIVLPHPVQPKEEQQEGLLLKIEKSDEMIAALRDRTYSASSLKTYIYCPIQFYLNYISKIKEPEELSEDLDASVFGSILHKALELIYQPYLSKPLNTAILNTLAESSLIEEKIKIAIEALELPKEITQGSNRLQLKIIERIAQKIIENDAIQKNLLVLNTEETLIWDNLQLNDGTFVKVQGTLDRIDKVGTKGIRIIDYKTGKIELPDFPDMTNASQIDEFFNDLFTLGKHDYSVAFQGMLYALIYYKLNFCNEIYVGYHHAKKMKGGIVYLNDGNPIPTELLLHFEKRLSKLISEIVYEVPYFIQSEDEKAYQYSPYAELLGID